MNAALKVIKRSGSFRDLLLFLGLVGAGWVVALWILNGSPQMLALGGMAFVMVIIAGGILRNWRMGFSLFILWLLFEDLARKYLGNGTALFFGKDVLAFLIYLSLSIACKRGDVAWFRPRFRGPLALFAALAVIQVLNPWSPSVIYGLLGLKLYFFYVPLIFVGYGLVRTGRELDHFLVYNVILGSLIAALGIVQSIVGFSFLSPATLAPELQHMGQLTRLSPITHLAVVAPTSVFVSAGRFGTFVVLTTILALGTQAYLLLTRRRVVYGFLCIGIAIVAAMQSGSRGCIIYTIISALVLSAGFLWGATWRWGQGQRLVKVVRRTCLVSAAGLFLMVELSPTSIGASWAFYSETLSPGSSASELRYRSWDYPIAALEQAFGHERWPYGYGTGTASLGTDYVARLLNKPPLNNNWVENGWGELILEMGILGPILWLIWSVSLLYYAWKIVRHLRGTVYFPVAFSIFWYAFLLLIPFTYGGLSPYQNYVMNAYFWVLIGVLFRLPLLARSPLGSSRSTGTTLQGSAAYPGGQ
jgi:hypothetical protein